MKIAVESVVASQDVLGECTIWCDRDQVLWWVDIRKIEIGGGPVLQLWAVLREAAGNALGFPSTSGSGNILLIGVIFFIGWQIVRLARAASTRPRCSRTSTPWARRS
jgi:hypothetical protein